MKKEMREKKKEKRERMGNERRGIIGRVPRRDNITVTTVRLGAPPPSLFESDCQIFWVYLLGQIAEKSIPSEVRPSLPHDLFDLI